MVIGYFVIAFTLFFLSYKKYLPILKKKKGEDTYSLIVDFKEFWFMILIPLFWVVGIPGLFIWRLFERLYKKHSGKLEKFDKFL